MDTFGKKLREVIESRGLSLEDVAQASGLGMHNLQALERGDLGALPEDDSVTDGLQAFARLVDVDPDEVIDDYLRERENYMRAAPTNIEVEAVRDVPQMPDEVAVVRDVPQVSAEVAAVRDVPQMPAEVEAVRDVPQVPDIGMQRTSSRSSRSPGLFALAAAALVLTVAGFSWLQFSGRDVSAPENPVASNEGLMVPENTPGTPGALPALPGEVETSTGQGVTPDGNSPLPMDQAQDAAAESFEPTAPVPLAATAVMPSGLVISQHRNIMQEK